MSNQTPTYSLLIPARERLRLVNNFADSICNTTKNHNDIEILFAHDDDEIVTSDALNNIKTRYEKYFNVEIHKRPRSIYLNNDYYNWLGSKAHGQFLWILADDLLFLQKEWDVEIKNIIEDYLKDKKDRIVCASIKDNTPKPNPEMPPFPCFPMFSREAYNASGMLLHPKIPTWGADFLAYNIYHPINRLLEIKHKTFINHISNHTGQVISDPVNVRIGSIFNHYKNLPENNIQRILREEVPGIRNKLLQYIKEKE